ncbi:MAG TPA: matrixin family metalloprotease [Bacteriovoracaceae bacterium]|nr:matrixin family metalloprotease [Bacteriovoracaceae bacterium]
MRLLYSLLLTLSTQVLGHQSTINSSGNQVLWYNSSIPLQVRTNSNDLSPAEVSSIIETSVGQWNGASSTKINLSVASTNEIRFVTDFPFGSAVLGVTEVSYNASGIIQRAVISINDDYDYSATPGPVNTGKSFLGDIITHELGHFLGLSHSEVLNASMFYSTFSGQSSLSMDDQSGVRQKYDDSFGKIKGRVQGGSRVDVLGVHVLAVSKSTGDTTGAVSDEDGNFEIGGLDLEDTYYLYTSPLKNPKSFPEYFANVQTDFCPASFVGSFFSACGKENDGLPQGINVTLTDPVIDVGVVTINCGLKVGQAYLEEKHKQNFNPLVIYDYGSDEKNEKAFVGYFRYSTANAFSTSDVLKIDLSDFLVPGGPQKFLKVSLVSYPFGAQHEYLMKVKKSGATVSTQGMSYSTTTRTYDVDLDTLIPLSSSPALNTFEIDLAARRLEPDFVLPRTFPSAGEFSSTGHTPYLLIMSIWEATPSGPRPLLDPQPFLSDNASCLDAPFTYAVSKSDPIDLPRLAGPAAGAVASCGTIEPPKGPGPGSPGLLLTVLGFLVTLLPNLLSKRPKKFLS